MKLNKIRYIVVSLIAMFAVVGAVNAVGVFYYDSAANQFVLDGSLKISDPGSFKLLLRELNSTDDSHLYINGRKDVQIRLDADNNDASKFKINNGVNGEVFSVDEGGNTVNTGNLTVTGTTNMRSGGIYTNQTADPDNLFQFKSTRTNTYSYLGQDNNNDDNFYIIPAPGKSVIIGGNTTVAGFLTVTGYGIDLNGDSTVRLSIPNGYISANRYCTAGGNCFTAADVIALKAGTGGVADGNSFGGMFTLDSSTIPTNWQLAGCAASNRKNPFTSDCTCPLNYTAQEILTIGTVRVINCYKI